MARGRSSYGREVLVRLDRSASVPLRCQLEAALRDRVRDGRLTAGETLPSTRALAADLGVTRGVVVEAYAQLAAEGWLAARPGSATVVAGPLPAGPGTAPGEAAPAAAAALPRIDFRPGMADLARFPRREWLAAMRAVLAEAPDAAFGYADPRGAPELRRSLAAYLGRVRGLVTSPDQIVVCNGVAQGLALLGRVLAATGLRAVAVEDPGSPDVRGQLSRAGMAPVPVPVDERGLVTGALAARAGTRAVLVTPAHQFPMGVVLAPERRAALVAWARQVDGLVIEDDYDAEFRYDHPPLGAVQGLAPEHVVHTGSVSKALAPALRLGWLAAAPGLAGRLADAKRDDDLHAPTLDQLALARFLDSGGYDRHLRRVRLAHRRRRDALAAALARNLPGARLTGVAAGLAAVVELPPAAAEDQVVAAAAALGVAVRPLGSCRLASQGPPAIVLAYGNLSLGAIADGIRLLGLACRNSTKSAR